MANRAIRTFGDPVLRTTCEPVTQFGESTVALAQDLLDTAAPEGRAAVAAPQIGIAVRAFGYDLHGRRGVVFNPEVVASGEVRDIDEGCLSVPGLFFPTPRYEFATVRGVDEHGQTVEISGDGVFAQMLQHETDHLNGVVYVQTLPSDRRKEAMRQIRQSDWFMK
ncbi:peptide deformylase [uncultured Brevibacterium sp.]|uniref:peptide deformylase n=1 Tax=uncultured Brevibacterium sp. TaxID=189678 RepID=UPI0025F67573|nr:peptide deformylase [uncultured Brevibacterium sp.]